MRRTERRMTKAPRDSESMDRQGESSPDSTQDEVTINRTDLEWHALLSSLESAQDVERWLVEVERALDAARSRATSLAGATSSWTAGSSVPRSEGLHPVDGISADELSSIG